MARPLRMEYPGAFYHVTSRGNEKKDVFLSRSDGERFLSYLEGATERHGAAIHVYCLMRNHYHLLLETPEGNLSQIMHHINVGYTAYFNRKHERVGHLFQGRYKAILVDADAYAQELSRYIHLNPVRAGVAERAEEYTWSSYACYAGLRGPPPWLRMDFILNYFGKSTRDAHGRYREFVESMMGRAEYESPLKDSVAGTILGCSDFVERIKERYLAGREVCRDISGLRQLVPASSSLDAIAEEVNSLLGGNEKLCRNAALYLCHRYSGRKLREIGLHFGVSESGVTQASRRFALSLQDDATLRETIDRIRIKLAQGSGLHI